MKWLLLTHVLAAVIGIGPTFFSHYITRNAQTIDEFRHSYKTGKVLYFFPLIGGPLAIISGILLAYLSGYDIFSTFWLYGSLLIYVIIQVLALGFFYPKIERISKWVNREENSGKFTFPIEQQKQIKHVNWILNSISILSIILFTLMVLKPVLS